MALEESYEDDRGIWRVRRVPSRDLTVSRYLKSMEDKTLYTDDITGVKPYGWESVPSDYEINFLFEIEHVGASMIPLPESLSSFIHHNRRIHFEHMDIEMHWTCESHGVTGADEVALIYVSITQILRGELFQVGAESVSLGNSVLVAEANANVKINDLMVQFTSALMSAGEGERGDAFVTLKQRNRFIRYIKESSGGGVIVTPFGESKEVVSMGTPSGRLFAEQGPQDELFLREMSAIQAEQDDEKGRLAEQATIEQYPVEEQPTSTYGEGQPPTETYGKTAYGEYGEGPEEIEYEFAVDDGPEIFEVEDVAPSDALELPIEETNGYPGDYGYPDEKEFTEEKPFEFRVSVDKPEDNGLGELFGADVDEQEIARRQMERGLQPAQKPSFTDRISTPINMVLSAGKGLIKRLFGDR